LNANPAHILGISMGGMIAFQLAIDFPALVKSLVIVNSTPELITRTLRDRWHMWQRLLIVRLLGMRKMGEVLGDRFFPEPEQEPLRTIFADRWAENHKPAYLEAMKGIFGWSVVGQLSEIHSPMLVLGSDGDYFPIGEKEVYVKRIPGAKLIVIENTRHALPAEKPDVFNTVVADFLAGLRGG
jgi:pimeloyl-ACP methyl ester carboxylesterase